MPASTGQEGSVRGSTPGAGKRKIEICRPYKIETDGGHWKTDRKIRKQKRLKRATSNFYLATGSPKIAENATKILFFNRFVISKMKLIILSFSKLEKS